MRSIATNLVLQGGDSVGALLRRSAFDDQVGVKRSWLGGVLEDRLDLGLVVGLCQALLAAAVAAAEPDAANAVTVPTAADVRHPPMAGTIVAARGGGPCNETRERDVAQLSRLRPMRLLRGEPRRVLAAVATFTLDGVHAQEVTVEVDVRRGLPAFTLVGLPAGRSGSRASG